MPPTKSPDHRGVAPDIATAGGRPERYDALVRPQHAHARRRTRRAPRRGRRREVHHLAEPPRQRRPQLLVAAADAAEEHVLHDGVIRLRKAATSGTRPEGRAPPRRAYADRHAALAFASLISARRSSTAAAKSTSTRARARASSGGDEAVVRARQVRRAPTTWHARARADASAARAARRRAWGADRLAHQVVVPLLLLDRGARRRRAQEDARRKEPRNRQAMEYRRGKLARRLRREAYRPNSGHRVRRRRSGSHTAHTQAPCALRRRRRSRSRTSSIATGCAVGVARRGAAAAAAPPRRR